MPALGGHALEMNLSRGRLARLLAPAAWFAEHCNRPDIAFGNLVPPSLLSLGPDLRSATRLAAEQEVDVMPAPDELRRAVAASGTKVRRVYNNVSLRQLALGSNSFAFTLTHQFDLLRAAQATTLKDGRASRADGFHEAHKAVSLAFPPEAGG